MIDKFVKLVAVAEAMATAWNDAGDCVEGMDVQVECNQGVVRVGVFGIVGVNFSSDDNVHFPEYGVDYRNYYYDWIDGEWILNQPKVVGQSFVEVEEIDPLPF